MYKTISNKIIREFDPCYDPSEVIKDENEELPVKDWVQKYRNVVHPIDIFWILSRTEFLSKKDLILFVVWCAREALKLIEKPDERSVNACNVAERYANGKATKEELLAVSDAAHDAVNDTHDAVNDTGAYTVAFHIYYGISATANVAYHVYYAARAAANAAYYAASTAIDVANANASDAASSAYYTSKAAADAAYYTSKAAYFASKAAYGAYDDAYDAARDSQLDKLLTYFE